MTQGRGTRACRGKMFRKQTPFALLALFLSGIILTGCASRRARRAGPEPASRHGRADSTEFQYRIYYVQRGDTLLSIARRTGVSAKALQETNDCSPRDLRIGQALLVPLHAAGSRTDGLTREAEPAISPTVDADRFSIVIDAGHGGKDPGAVSPIGLLEKDVNLAVSRETARLLEGDGFDVHMTRRTDRFIELNDRAAIGNRAEADLFVSIHADSCRNPAARGYTLYIRRNASPRCRSAAGAIEKALARSGFGRRGVRRADYRVLVKSDGPAVLVELGFLSNREEARMLQDSETQNQLAACIAEGIRSFFGN